MATDSEDAEEVTEELSTTDRARLVIGSALSCVTAGAGASVIAQQPTDPILVCAGGALTVFAASQFHDLREFSRKNAGGDA
ncbi:hypothetical protein M0R88_05965 [Halorussus gelatinilyticus]|uniref:Uncharacterized protein n=1 Tax=Halorussus gelatinilyticus TaxID=2937524 RepID=A0A8U0ILW4_9EURY|nr:hypothetical protein [Halorussus gelatinilyticus]UPW01645.1 hypothetical protein M0R88_05965 [Halorussus gelatinilyticus]